MMNSFNLVAEEQENEDRGSDGRGTADGRNSAIKASESDQRTKE